MTGFMAFNRPYLAFGPQTEPYQRADDVGYAVTEFLWFKGRPYYPASALAEARIASLPLSVATVDAADEDNLSLIFRMSEAEGGHFFEIVLRSDAGTAYGGWLWGQELVPLDEFHDGFRVLTTICNGAAIRFEYRRELGYYQCCSPLPIEKKLVSEPQRGSALAIEAEQATD